MTGGSDDGLPPRDGFRTADHARGSATEPPGEPPGETNTAAPRPRPGSRPHPAVGVDRLARPDEEMERLMSGDLGPLRGPSSAQSDAPASPVGDDRLGPTGDDAPTLDKSQRLRLRELESERAPAPIRPDALAPARASRPVGPASVPAAPPRRRSPWPWIGGATVLLGAWVAFVVGRDSADPAGAKTTAPSDPGVAVAPKSPKRSAPPTRRSDATPRRSEPESLASPERVVSSSIDSAAFPTRSDDLRAPPPGTPAEAAAAFRRLPISPSDGPPIGGIGANGIHVDELQMSREVRRGTCTGETGEFSVSARDRAVLCVRVVHPREKDELTVLWQKHGGSARRSKMVVLPKHAYRTRGYLKLREEYIGDWTVRILSSDGVELARHDFTVVP